jgi:hypothetical protein
MLIALTNISIQLSALVIGRLNLSVKFSAQVTLQFSESKEITGKTFCHDQLFGLPEPLHRDRSRRCMCNAVRGNMLWQWKVLQ